jgi:hypothetical protein
MAATAAVAAVPGRIWLREASSVTSFELDATEAVRNRILGGDGRAVETCT